jgi:hypothetical protein
MRAVEDLARDDSVALGDLVQDRGAEVWERGAETVELSTDALSTRRNPGRPAVVYDVGVHQLVQGSLVGCALVFLDEAADYISGLHVWILLRWSFITMRIASRRAVRIGRPTHP